MKKFGLTPRVKKRRQSRKSEDEGMLQSKYLNLVKHFCPIRPNVVWVTDFTYILYQGRFWYLATVMDIYTRKILAWQISGNRSKELVTNTLKEALLDTEKLPLFVHSDQGSEYLSYMFTKFLESLGVQVSMSKKASPWENGFQESFYSRFKSEMNDFNQYSTIGELIEAIHYWMNYYNKRRIHTSLNASPVKFHQQYLQKHRRISL